MKFTLNIDGFEQEINYDSNEIESISTDPIKDTTIKQEYQFGTIKFREIVLDIGTILISDYHFTQEGIKSHNSFKGHFLEMHFNLGNSIALNSNDQKYAITMQPMSYNMLCLTEIDGYMDFGKGKLFRTFDIHFTPEFYKQFKGYDTQIDLFFERSKTEPATTLFPNSIPISDKMKMIIGDITNCSYSKNLRKKYLETKATELFLLHLEHCLNKKEIRETLFNFSDEQIKQINQTREYIETNLRQPLNATELAYKFKIREYKLKQGFKVLLGTTITAYSQECRIKHAHKLLKKGIPISEVIEEVGYANHSSFNVAFKKVLGFSPNKV